jgi:serine/threonine-protein kinase
VLSSNETAQVKVPSVIGFTQDAAERAIRQAGLKPVVETKVSDRTPQTVLSQDPSAGEMVDTDSEVTITVAKAPRQVEVPSVAGQTVDEATATLNEAGLSLGNVDEQESDQTEGTIIGQNPTAGSSVDKGTPVDVVVAVAPSPSPTPNVTVTDYTCESLGHAQGELDKAGFDVVISNTPQFNEQCPQPNKVASQDPTSGSFPPGTTVTLVPTTTESPSPEGQ